MGETTALAENRLQDGQGGPAGKFLTFSLGTEVFGIEILKVQEIIGIMSTTSVPNAANHVRGVINLRGKVIPVVELRLKFLMKPVDDTGRTCIIVVQVKGLDGPVTIGILVDEVSEVIQINQSQIEAPPALGARINTSALLGLGKSGGRVVILLDVDKVLGLNEMEQPERVFQE